MTLDIEALKALALGGDHPGASVLISARELLAFIARLEAAERVVEAARVGARCHDGKGYSEENYAKAPAGSSLGQIQVLRVALATYDTRVKP